MGVRISRSLLDGLLAEAAGFPDREVCGLLFGDGQAIETARRASNISPNPENSFEIDPQPLFEAIRAERGGGPRLLGWYHSHPSGAAEPSAQDARDAAPDGRLWLVLTSREARLWRAVADGAHLGRFAPVRLDVSEA